MGKVNGKGCRVFRLQIHLFTRLFIMCYADTFVVCCHMHAVCWLAVTALLRV